MKLIFDDKNYTAILIIDKESFEFEKIRKFAEKNNLSEKEEIHMTIIGSLTGKTIKEKHEKNWGKIKDIINKTKWKFAVGNKFYFVEKIYEEYNNEKREAIVQLLKSPPLTELYEKLNGLLATNFEAPFPHVTLFSTSTNPDKVLRGIGIYSTKQFKNLNPKFISDKVASPF